MPHQPMKNGRAGKPMELADSNRCVEKQLVMAGKTEINY